MADDLRSRLQIARSLLRLMRNPAGVIEQIHEVCDIAEREFVRTIRMQFRSKRAHEEILVDLIHPWKGDLVDLDLTESRSSLSRLSHAEHLQVSQFLVNFRFVSVWKSALVPEDANLRFFRAMALAQYDLERIPRLAPAEARKVLARTFDLKSGILWAVLRAPRCSVDVKKMRGLFRLCEELCDRYLLLSRLTLTKGQGEITYSYRHDVSESPDLVEWRRTLGQRRHARYGAPPVALRIHVPLAKRTKHYTLKVEAPVDYFFARQVLLTDVDVRSHRWWRIFRRRAPASTVSRRLRWSVNTGRGQRSYVFIRNGRSEVGRIYVGLLNLERPGRSTSRVATTAWFVSLMLLGFAAVKTLGSNPAIDAASVVLAAISIGSLAIEATMPNRGLLGVPLISRFVPVALAFAAALFSLWLLSYDDHRDVDLLPTNGSADTVTLVWHLWKYGASWILIAATVSLAIFASYRRHILIRHYREVIDNDNVRVHNMY